MRRSILRVLSGNSGCSSLILLQDSTSNHVLCVGRVGGMWSRGLLCCRWHHSCGDTNKPSSQTGHKPAKGRTPPKPRLVNKQILPGLLIGVWVRGYFQGRNAKTAVSPKATPAWMKTSESRTPGAHCTACRQLNRLERVLSRQLSAVSVSSGQLGWSKWMFISYTHPLLLPLFKFVWVCIEILLNWADGSG